MALTFLALFAFTLQSIVTQIHIHNIEPAQAATKAPGKAPASPQSNCPICQAIVHAGQFTSPVAAVLPVLVFLGFAIVLVKTRPGIARPAPHDWQSRAPPRL